MLHGLHVVIADAIDREEHDAGLARQARKLWVPVFDATIMMEQVRSEPASHFTRAGYFADLAADMASQCAARLAVCAQPRYFQHDYFRGGEFLGAPRGFRAIGTFGGQTFFRQPQTSLDALAMRRFGGNGST